MIEALILIGYGWLTIIAIMFVAWLFHLRLDNASIVDVAWAVGLMGAAVTQWLMTETRTSLHLVSLLLILLWGLRLSGHLFMTRVIPAFHDERYAQISAKWQHARAFKFLLHFQFQGLLQMLLTVGFVFIFLNHELSIHVAYGLGVILIFIGIVGESLADLQLLRFSRNPDNKGQVMNHGLWHYSRHPNYFFEWLVWLGLACMSLAHPYGWLALFAPLVLLGIMLGITAPLTERQSLKSRGEAYAQYQRQTSQFVPLPPKKPTA